MKHLKFKLNNDDLGKKTRMKNVLRLRIFIICFKKLFSFKYHFEIL